MHKEIWKKILSAPLGLRVLRVVRLQSSNTIMKVPCLAHPLLQAIVEPQDHSILI